MQAKQFRRNDVSWYYPILKSMTRRIIFVFLLFLAISSIGAYVYVKAKFQPPPNQLSYTEEQVTIPFFRESMDGRRTDKGAGIILITVSLGDVQKPYYMRLDVGAPYSVLFQHSIEVFQKTSDTLNVKEENGSRIVTGFRFFLDTIPILAQNLFVVPSPEKTSSEDTSGITIIGILGADLIEKRKVVINYQDNYIMLGSQFPETLMIKAVFSTFTFDGRRVVLPATIQKRKYKLLYHTGPGHYDILTIRQKWKKLVPQDARIEKSRITLWGNRVPASLALVKIPVLLGGIQLPIKNIAYVEEIPFMQRMILRLSGITGITGNQLFSNGILLLDTEQEKFAIVK